MVYPIGYALGRLACGSRVQCLGVAIIFWTGGWGLHNFGRPLFTEQTGILHLASTSPNTPTVEIWRLVVTPLIQSSLGQIVFFFESIMDNGTKYSEHSAHFLLFHASFNHMSRRHFCQYQTDKLLTDQKYFLTVVDQGQTR